MDFDLSALDRWILGNSNPEDDDEGRVYPGDEDLDRAERVEAADANASSIVAVIAMLDGAVWSYRRDRDLAIWRAELALRGGVAS
jgi:hypothetical protein